MRSLVYYVAVSLDGFIAAPDGDFSAFLAEGDHMTALVRDHPDTLPGAARDALGVSVPPTRFDTVVMGWNTYAVALPVGISDPYPHLRTIVFTSDPDARRAEAGPGAARVEFTSDDPGATIRQLKTDPSPLAVWLCGGGQLAGAVHDEIDSLVLKVNPIVLGDGIGLFGGLAGAREQRAFTLSGSTAYDSGVVINEYTR
jgi:dihydrofolate reductase